MWEHPHIIISSIQYSVSHYNSEHPSIHWPWQQSLNHLFYSVLRYTSIALSRSLHLFLPSLIIRPFCGPQANQPMSTSHAHSLFRLTNDRAVNTAEICIKGGQLRPQGIHSSAATRRQSKIASIKKEAVDLTSRRNSRTCRLKKALPALYREE